MEAHIAPVRHCSYLPSWAMRLYFALLLAGNSMSKLPSSFVMASKRESPRAYLLYHSGPPPRLATYRFSVGIDNMATNHTSRSTIIFTTGIPETQSKGDC